MPIVYLEDFVRPDHLNGNGTVKYNVNTAYAANAFGNAMRLGTITGESAGPFGWPSLLGCLKSPMYLWNEPVNWTVIGSSQIRSTVGASVIYSGDGFRSAGKYTVDEYNLLSQYVASPFRNGIPDTGGVTVAPTLSPQIDMTGCSGNTLSDLGVYAQKVVGTGTGQPTSCPGVGILVTGLERVQKYPVGHPLAGQLYWNGAGGSGGSNDNTFSRVAWSGFWTGAGLHLLNCIITTIRDCGFGGFFNSSPTRLIASTQHPLNIASVAPIPFNSASIQSPFYPNIPNPLYRSGADGDQRYLITETAAGALVIDNTAVHSMVKDTFPSPGQSNVAAPILLHKNKQVSIRNKPLGHDGILAMVEVYNYATQLLFEGVEFWNSDSHGNSQQARMIWLNNCRYPNPGEEGQYSPVIGLTVNNCVLNGGYYSGTYIQGIGGSAICNMDFGPSNNIKGDMSILSLNQGWANPTASFLENSSIWFKGSPLVLGGSLTNTNRLYSPGTVTLSPGGTDNGRRM